MSEFEINNPIEYKGESGKGKNFILFPETTFKNIKFFDCNDTIDGICYEDKTLDECIKMCEPPHCGIGQYITTQKGSICVPNKSDVYPDLNPSHKLRRQNIYSEMKNSKSTIFMNKSMHEFPPNEGNNIFYLDVVQLQAVNNNFIMGRHDDPPKTLFDDDSLGTDIQILPSKLSGVASDNRNLPVRYNQKVIFRVPDTSYILGKDDLYPELEWESKILSNNDETYTFKIIPTESSKGKEGKINYDSEFYLIYNDISYCYVNKNGQFIVDATVNLEKREEQGLNSKFRFIPKNIGYHCDNGQCKEISLKTMLDKGIDPKNVFRNESCYNLCGEKKSLLNNFRTKIITNNQNGIPFWLLISIIIVSIILYIIFLRI
jgi:hypothetical protein